MPEVKPRKWKPLQPLAESWKDLEDPGIAALAKVWTEQVGELQDKEVYKSFLTKLRREWSIETGVLERLYDLKDSATKTLIEHGLDASLLVSSDTDKPVEQVMALIRDQEAAIASMYRFIAEGRKLSLGYIRELHSVLTTNQTTCESEDPDGRMVTIPLRRGDWRQTEAQITDAEGKTWLYCEPSLLESQMLDLVSEYERQVDLEIPPEIRSAWLHHGFTLIHPFQDGNGRVARCLATVVMLKAKWFPLVVTRNDKAKYIAALRSADAGDLKPLVQHFNELQKRAIRRALSLSETIITEHETVKSALAAASVRLNDRTKAMLKSQKKVLEVAEVLRTKSAERLREVVDETDTMLKRHNAQYDAWFDEAAHGSPRDNYYRTQIVECAIAHDYFANLPEYRAWAIAAFKTDEQKESKARTELLLSFHGIGRGTKGVLGCSAIYCIRDLEGSIVGVEPLAAEPFEFTYRDDPFEVVTRFAPWLDEAVANGVQKWSATL